MTTHVHLSRRLLVPAAGLAAVLAAPGALAGATTSYTYVAGHPGHVAGMHLVRDVSSPAGRLAATGRMDVRLVSSSFALTVDDKAALDGQSVPVILQQARPDGTSDVRLVCVPVREPVRHAGFLASRPVSIEVQSATWLLTVCDSFGTTGTITVAP